MRSPLVVALTVLSLAACTERTPGPRRDAGGGDGGGDGTDSGRPPIPMVDASGCVTRGPDDDVDMDGFSPAQGDCYDCSPQVNPGAFDDPGNDVDEDCSGAAATELELCDTGLALDASDPRDAARAIGLCRFTTDSERTWGVLSARWTLADGTGVPGSDMQHGLMSNFGRVGARGGNSMLALSSGAARSTSQPGFTSDCDEYTFGPSGSWPAGLDRSSPACPGVTSGDPFDAIALEVRVRVPTNAEGFRFESNFFTYEYPNYICSEYNDFFVVLMEPRPMGSTDGNIVFDADGNKVSVNNSLLRACSPGTFGGRTFTCPLGVAPLAETSYDDTALCGDEGIPGFPFPFPTSMGPIGASTGWLRTSSPVEGGAIVTLRFAVWDAGDPVLDSLVLVDAFEWTVEDPGTVITDPILF
jgi:hypothetical protein